MSQMKKLLKDETHREREAEKGAAAAAQWEKEAVQEAAAADARQEKEALHYPLSVT